MAQSKVRTVRTVVNSLAAVAACAFASTIQAEELPTHRFGAWAVTDYAEAPEPSPECRLTANDTADGGVHFYIRGSRYSATVVEGVFQKQGASYGFHSDQKVLITVDKNSFVFPTTTYGSIISIYISADSPYPGRLMEAPDGSVMTALGGKVLFNEALSAKKLTIHLSDDNYSIPLQPGFDDAWHRFEACITNKKPQ